MARRTDATVFLDAVRESGGRISNKSLRTLLGWSEEKYWKIHQTHFDEGNIEKGRGPGGTVILVNQHNPVAPADVAASDSAGDPSPPAPREIELYDSVLKELQGNWARHRQLDECHCELTAQQGRRDTGGSWTRPDITVCGYKKYEYIPDKILEVNTFEIKAVNDVSIKGVMEALAHREAATRSYVIYHTSGRDLSDFPEGVRIEELSVRHGVGLFVAKDIKDFKSWDELASASRSNADPDAIETFIKRTLSEGSKSKLRKWF